MTHWNGHVCVQKSKDIDAAMMLAHENWEHYFDTAYIELNTWEQLEKAGLWEKINISCNKLIDRYEEEWVENLESLEIIQKLAQHYLDYFNRLKNYSSVEENTLNFLQKLDFLAYTAKQRNVPLIFTF